MRGDKKPFVIGIAGPSCSGKTSLAKLLARKLAGSAAVLSLDAYYRDLSALDPEKREIMNFDHPDALDYPLLSTHVRDLVAGKTINRPVYDFRKHSRMDRAEEVFPAALIIVEGIFALYWEEIRRQYDCAIFMDLEGDEAIRRRISRDVKERGREPDSVIRQYELTVRPMFEKYVSGTRAYADLLVSGAEPTEATVDRILNCLPAAFDD